MLNKTPLQPIKTKFELVFTQRRIVLKNKDGSIREDFMGEFPEFWSDQSCKVVADKYFRVVNGLKETSARQIVNRVVHTIAEWGRADKYFIDADEYCTFGQNLENILYYQLGSFNSPVYFNVGVRPDPQTSACFIMPVRDNMESIAEWYSTSMLVYKGGSGLGTNPSALRGSNEKLSVGGRSSGPISFIKSADCIAGSIASGGAVRRAATIVSLEVDHPNIMDFIKMKAHEEKKAQALLDAGYSGGMDGEAYSSVAFQNMNVSTRCSDAFMEAAENHQPWSLINRLDGSVHSTLDANDMLMQMAILSHKCGDPGIQFTDTTNRWNTCKNSGRIMASNPCAEFVFDVYDGWGACNLASVNPVALERVDSPFDVALEDITQTLIFAMDIIIDRSGWPHPKFGEAARTFRPLGLGYSNLGVWLLTQKVPYGSVRGRELAAQLTHNLTLFAYKASGELARRKGAFSEYQKNKDCFIEVLSSHAYPNHDGFSKVIAEYAEVGFRNAQVTLLAPTGTISFWMGCDSNGPEPLFSLNTYKEFVGGGMEKITIPIVDNVLRSLGCQTLAEVPDDIVGIFQTAMNENERVPPLTPGDHIDMMAAVQPYISGAISKTINMPAHATIEDVYNAYMEAWKKGLKSITIYRDGSKRFQPLNLEKEKVALILGDTADDLFKAFEACEAEEKGKFLERIASLLPLQPKRRKLPADRTSTTHSFQISNFKGTLHIGFYPDTKKVGEIFITASKSGTTINGLLDCWAICLSYALQYGVPLSVLTRKFSFQRFEPEGWTSNPHINHAHSIVDYIARLLDSQYNDEKANERDWLTPIVPSANHNVKDDYGDPEVCEEFDAPLCDRCGTLTRRVGACHTCPSCGESTGCG